MSFHKVTLVLQLCIFLDYIFTINGQLETLGHCLKDNSKDTTLVKCFGQQALNTLQEFDNLSNFSLASGLLVVKDEQSMGRSIPNFLDQDPTDFRGLFENAGVVMSQRTLQWDMKQVYPGLRMRIGPSLGTNGLLEFYIDPAFQYDERSYDEPPSTARIVAKKFVVPFLLGLKFNMATLLPLVLGLLILVSKKAVFLSKLAIFISSVFGVGGLFGGLAGGVGLGGYGYGNSGGYGHKPYPGSYGHYHEDAHHGGIYKTAESPIQNKDERLPIVDHFYDYDQQQLKDRGSRLYERELVEDVVQPRNAPLKNQRSFAWHSVNN